MMALFSFLSPRPPHSRCSRVSDFPVEAELRRNIMGWLKLGARKAAETRDLLSCPDFKPQTQHIESVSALPFATHYPFQDLSVTDGELPFISSTEVAKRTSRASGGLWIVVDNIVYDCTEFINEHPGGEEVILSFGGQDCSWQFWRFHGIKEMQKFGKTLRVGRTEGLKNRFKEPVKWVGLQSRGLDEW
jgi:cytochrome b involved in lipid metabolism